MTGVAYFPSLTNDQSNSGGSPLYFVGSLRVSFTAFLFFIVKLNTK